MKVKLLNPRADPGVFAIFSNSFLSCVVGKMAYKEAVTEGRITEFVTVSNEAYALLYLENSYDQWKAEAVDDPKPPSMMGWNQDHIVRYNDQHRSVKAKRKEMGTKKLEDGFRDQMQNRRKKVPKEIEHSLEPTWDDSEEETSDHESAAD